MGTVADPGAAATTADQRRRWSFGDAVLDGRSLRLYVGGRAVELEMKPLEVLRHLLQHAGDAVSKDDLLKAVWPGRILSDSALTNTMAKLREALGDDAQAIKTVHAFGYRLEADVRVSSGDAAPAGTTESSGRGAAAAVVPQIAVASRLPSQRMAALAAIVAALVAGGALWFLRRPESPPPVEKSIAVLPFANTSGDPANEYFSDGLSEEMIAMLGKSSELRVIGRTSSFQFKNAAENSRSIGEKLGVTWLLEGSVRKADDRVRVTVQLVRAADGAALWSETYDRDIKDTFAVQGDIAATVARRLEVSLGRTGAPPSGNVEAYDALLRGDFHLRPDRDAIRKAFDYYERAIELDPGYAAAYARLATAHGFLVEMDNRLTNDEVRQQLAQAHAAADTALKLDPNLADGHLARASVLAYEMDYRGAAAEAEHAAELAPQHAPAVMTLGVMRDLLGRFDEAIALHQRAVALNPLFGLSHMNLALALSAAGRYEEAEAAQRRALEVAPEVPFGHALLGAVQILRGNPDAALESARLEPDEQTRLWAFAMAHAARRDRVEADAALERLLAGGGERMPYLVAQVYALRQEPDRMFASLDRAVATRDASVGRLLGNRFFAPWREDPRFVAIAEKIGVLPKKLGAQPHESGGT